MINNFYKRLAYIEAMVLSQQSNSVEGLTKRYLLACDNNDEEDAALSARMLRNKLLEESDKEMTLDRLGINVSSVDQLVSSLNKILQNDWAVYRQKLRDLPEQKGFPFNIIFPESPNSKKEGILNENF